MTRAEKFLRKEGVWEKFKKNFKEIHGDTDTLEDHFKESGNEFAISYAFIWGNTPEGFIFWHDLNNKYRKYRKYRKHFC